MFNSMFNTYDRFGSIAILLHWIMALTAVLMLALGLYMTDLDYYDPLYKILPFIHKSIGILFALLLCPRIIWTLINLTPKPLAMGHRLTVIAAKMAHLSLYCLMTMMVISGYLISTADGSAISVFGWFEVEATITSIAQQEDLAGLFHEYLAYFFIGLIILHSAAALNHHFICKNNTLRRMLATRL